MDVLLRLLTRDQRPRRQGQCWQPENMTLTSRPIALSDSDPDFGEISGDRFQMADRIACDGQSLLVFLISARVTLARRTSKNPHQQPERAA